MNSCISISNLCKVHKLKTFIQSWFSHGLFSFWFPALLLVDEDRENLCNQTHWTVCKNFHLKAQATFAEGWLIPSLTSAILHTTEAPFPTKVHFHVSKLKVLRCQFLCKWKHKLQHLYFQYSLANERPVKTENLAFPKLSGEGGREITWMQWIKTLKENSTESALSSTRLEISACFFLHKSFFLVKILV